MLRGPDPLTACLLENANCLSRGGLPRKALHPIEAQTAQVGAQIRALQQPGERGVHLSRLFGVEEPPRWSEQLRKRAPPARRDRKPAPHCLHSPKAQTL